MLDGVLGTVQVWLPSVWLVAAEPDTWDQHLPGRVCMLTEAKLWNCVRNI